MEKKKKTGPDECCRAERQIGYEVRTLNQVIGASGEFVSVQGG